MCVCVCVCVSPGLLPPYFYYNTAECSVLSLTVEARWICSMQWCLGVSETVFMLILNTGFSLLWNSHSSLPRKNLKRLFLCAAGVKNKAFPEQWGVPVQTRLNVETLNSSCLQVLLILLVFSFKVPWVTSNWFWVSLNLILMSHVLPPSANETISTLRCLCPVRSVSRNTMKRFMAHRPKRPFFCLRAWSISCSLFYSLWLEAGGDFFLTSFQH